MTLDLNSQPKWRQIGTIIFLVISIAFILTTALYFIFIPSPSYKKQSLKLQDKQISCDIIQTSLKEYCLVLNLDYSQYNVSVCRLFNDGTYEKYFCYDHYYSALESWMYKLKTEMAVFLSIIVLIIIGSLIFKTRIFGWGVIIGILYSFIVDVFLSKNFPYLLPPYKTFWMLIPCVIGGIFGVILHYFLKCKTTSHIT